MFEKNKLDIDIYQNEKINQKEEKKNRGIQNLDDNETKENKELEHLDELIIGEGTTMYGEFISSYFAWLGLNKQKTRANELNDMTKR